MKRRPLIGITTGLDDKERKELFLPTRYVDAVRTAGGLPVALPVLGAAEAAELADAVDGAVFIGGLDIPPDMYGEAPHPATVCVPRVRPEFELKLIDALCQRRKPILGICYGHQILNVAFGGTLLQDIPSQVQTNIAHRGTPSSRHPVRIERDSRLYDILQAAEIEIVSSHHQSVKTVGAGVRVVSHAPDGIIEATEFPVEHFVLSVQWHPEMDQTSVYTKRLFGALVQAASE
ncbi:MAG: gamma-glutamyl-gamma-aminobutyrate hydrolase family protein [Abditibacteriales bacterium]|nr:gamma-glutamyl-gamma-aminobutyrate hydrolase family protein [Abditibacteriales bacterium]MDW8365941.1 gamma-glutamyl-gamma-aminobutyrate hydrolase family protein [Abditibacteriales bacterium]